MTRLKLEVEIPAKVVARKASTKEVIRVTCDVCGTTVDNKLDNRYGSGMSKCSTCDRDICHKTKDKMFPLSTCYIYHPDDHGDYPRKMCIICEPLWYSLYSPMIERHDREEEAMEKRIKEESLNEHRK